ncbi:GntR family transcriptional regulator [Rothia uropygialis]|uniref:GntR family transcriptional regulator n=1 Tax=Kocuria sp. 36 TaxID=1415402 RepID=UPI00101BBB4E|nr:GntR family transcriptional regulator [Kocuria sp. 36]
MARGAANGFDRNAIFEKLRQEIIEGTLEQGSPLKESPLATRFNVSRTPVRDALVRLEQTGLAVRGNRGLAVKSIDPQSVVQVYRLRILLEEEAAGQAAENRTFNDVISLQALMSRDKEVDQDDEQALVRANLDFHEAVWQATQNKLLTSLLNEVTGQVVHAPKSTLSVGNRWAEALEEHEALVKAIEDREIASARRIARQHFEQALHIRMSLLRESVRQRIDG